MPWLFREPYHQRGELPYLCQQLRKNLVQYLCRLISHLARTKVWDPELNTMLAPSRSFEQRSISQMLEDSLHWRCFFKLVVQGLREIGVSYCVHNVTTAVLPSTSSMEMYTPISLSPWTTNLKNTVSPWTTNLKHSRTCNRQNSGFLLHCYYK